MESVQSGFRCGKLYACLSDLVDMMIERQKELGDTLDMLPKIKKAKEYSTIKLCSYRGAGHTSAIMKIVEEKFNKVIVIFPNMKFAERILRYYPDLKDKIVVCSPNCLDKIMGLFEYDAIIVDCSSLIPQTKIDEIYELTVYSSKNPLYIFME